MIKLLNTLRRFRRAERGNVTVEFALVFPVFIMILTSSIEMGVITIRQTLLERGLDIAMREVRVGTSANYSHDQVRAMICDGAAIFDDCEENLRLEMIRTTRATTHNCQAPWTVSSMALGVAKL